MDDTIIVEKVLRSVTPRFDNVVIAIEESGRVENMKVEELQGSLEVHEQRLNERISDKSSHQALQVQTTKKGAFLIRNSTNNQQRYVEQKSNSRKCYTNKVEQPEQSKRNGYKQFKGLKKKFDKKRVRSFNCDKFGYYSNECLTPSKNQNQRRQDSKAHLVKEEIDESDEEVVQFMMTTDCTTTRSDTWYLDSGCSNHMTRHKEWLAL
ncbi:PREDICTED: uncharacterized protein LOC109334027 [Lupinus angustifolius]|uniref:uncharacterized protein LOC109334027 n=1 Tax=Lupinus angustifolius TaxID=3871 RepID=UPI00092F9F4E|nr:PREDICTED: uncharacterized protein LOC109334027 [Lupinus angustifolius]